MNENRPQLFEHEQATESSMKEGKVPASDIARAAQRRDAYRSDPRAHTRRES